MYTDYMWTRWTRVQSYLTGNSSPTESKPQIITGGQRQYVGLASLLPQAWSTALTHQRLLTCVYAVSQRDFSRVSTQRHFLGLFSVIRMITHFPRRRRRARLSSSTPHRVSPRYPGGYPVRGTHRVYPEGLIDRVGSRGALMMAMKQAKRDESEIYTRL